MSTTTTVARLFRPFLKLPLFGAGVFCLSWTAAAEAEPAKAQPVFEWTTTDKQTHLGSFDRIDEQDQVVIHGDANAEIIIPFAKLTPEGRAQAQKLAKLPLTSVLYLGDSMSLEGFGKRLDRSLRENPRIGSVWTYMACATHPMSWMKKAPYTNIKTFCGFWSIESTKDSPRPVELNESNNYGSHKSGHVVPKIETLLETLKPDVLVMQSGNNFFSIFSDHVTIKPERHGGEMKYHVNSFMSHLANTPSTLRKVYWITPPQCGKVTEEIQQFVFDTIKENTRSLATLIDSRTMTHYPYKKMSKDKEHFEGQEALDWADDVYATIKKDLFVKPLASLPTVHEQAVAMGGWEKTDAKESKIPTIKVRATLLSKTPVPKPETFAPYHEFMVGFLYKIEKVIDGKYDGEKLLVMHPAYIDLKKQPLDDMKVGRSYEFHLRELDKTSLWKLIRSVDASESFDLSPYILVADEQRHPGASKKNSTGKQAAEKKSQS